MNPLPAGCIGTVTGTAVVLRGDDIDTDRIMPARFLRALTFEGLGDHVFEDDRAACARSGEVHPFDDTRYAGASILLVNRNFGCGSSREHAPQGLLRCGIRAIVGESFAEIFFGNATALGIPCVVMDVEAIARLMAVVARQPQTPILVDLRRTAVEAGGGASACALPSAVRDAFLNGSWDATGVLLEDFSQVRAVAARLPYLSGWT